MSKIAILLWEMADGILDNMRQAQRLVAEWPEDDRREYLAMLSRAQDVADELKAWGNQADVA